MNSGHRDPLARVESSRVGEACFFWAGVHVLAGARIGKNCKFGENCFVENDVVVGDGVTVKNNVCLWDGLRLEDRVFVGPNVVFTNDFRPRAWRALDAGRLGRTLIGEGASLGANATIVCGIAVGRFALVGAGAVLTRDVFPHEKVFGNPARHRGFVCECGDDLREEAGGWLCSCGHRYHNLKAGK
jgi:acetyltransferase-like isoleucine patch superfamily enzyme